MLDPESLESKYELNLNCVKIKPKDYNIKIYGTNLHMHTNSQYFSGALWEHIPPRKFLWASPS